MTNYQGKEETSSGKTGVQDIKVQLNVNINMGKQIGYYMAFKQLRSDYFELQIFIQCHQFTEFY